MTNSLKVALCAFVLAGSVTSGFAQEPISYSQQAKDLAFTAGRTLASAGSQVLSQGADAAHWTSTQASEAFKAVSDRTSILVQSSSDYWSNSFKVISAAIAQGCYKASESATAGFNWAVDKTPEGIKDFTVNHPYLTGIAIATPIALLVGYKMAKWGTTAAKPQVEEKRPVEQARPFNKPTPTLYIKLNDPKRV